MPLDIVNSGLVSIIPYDNESWFDWIPACTGMVGLNKMAIFERKFIEVKGINTAYVDQGSGPEMVLLHGGGGGCSADDFYLNIDPLSEHFHVYGLDQWGFGMTDKPPADCTMPARARHALDFMDAAGIESAHLVGHSQGGWVGTVIALDHPGRVRSNVLVDSGSTAPLGNLDEYGRISEGLRQAGGGVITGTGKEATRQILEVVIHNKDLISDAYVDAQYEHGRFPGNEETASERGRTGVWSPETEGKLALTDRLGSLKAPTFIIWGKQDTCAPLERGMKLMDLIPGSSIHIFDQASHCVMTDRAEEFNRLLIAFCK